MRFAAPKQTSKSATPQIERTTGACLEEERRAEPFEKRPAVNAKEKESGSTPC
jgi:hypothetical protein